MHPKTRTESMERLKKIQGQIAGISRMIAENRDCTEIIQQIASAEQALHRVGELVLSAHLNYCVQKIEKNPKMAEEVKNLVKAVLTYRR
jgi:DNA-binding FrmR family transcriptional regulator